MNLHPNTETQENRDLSAIEIKSPANKAIERALISRNITILGRRTTIRLELDMWSALSDVARRENCTIHEIASLVALRKNKDSSLTSSIRVFLLLYFRASSTEEGHAQCNHGSFERMKRRGQI